MSTSTSVYVFSNSGAFYNTKKVIAESLLLPIDMQIELFNINVKPVLLYGCELWGYGKLT